MLAELTYRSRGLWLLVVPAILAGAAGCASSGGGPIPAVSGAMTARSTAPAAILKQGRVLYAGRCTACHTAEPVRTYSPSEWTEIIDDMTVRSRLTPDEKKALLAYVRAVHALPGSAPAN